MTYTQAALALDTAPWELPDTILPMPSPDGGWSARLWHTRTSSGQRLPDDLWDEYRLECQIRERLALPFVSLAEFAAMRDRTDDGEETPA